MTERKEWIDSLKGIFCLIVMLSHNVALILPALFFGEQVYTSRNFEYIIHKTPLTVLWNGGAMVVLFFLVSGMLLNNSIKKKKYIDIVVNSYIKLLPMVAMGVLLSYIVMKMGLVYSIPLVEFSHSTTYAPNYNNFEPVVLGKDGIVFDVLIRTYLTASIYNNVFWYVASLFMGTLIAAGVGKILYRLDNRKLEIAGWMILFILFVFVGEKYLWGLEYAAAMIMGILIDNGYFKVEKIKYPIKVVFILIAVYVLSMNGSLLKYVGMEQLRGIEYIFAATIIVAMVSCDKKLQKKLDVKWLKKTGKLSFAIYASHWPVAISVSSGIALLLTRHVDYGVAGTLGIICGMIVSYVVAIVFDKIYKPCYKALSKVQNRILRARV